MNWHLGTVANYALYDVIKIVFKSFRAKEEFASFAALFFKFTQKQQQ